MANEQTESQQQAGRLTRERAGQDLTEVAHRLERMATRIRELAVPACQAPSSLPGCTNVTLTILQDLQMAQAANTNTLIALLNHVQYVIEKGVL